MNTLNNEMSKDLQNKVSVGALDFLVNWGLKGFKSTIEIECNTDPNGMKLCQAKVRNLTEEWPTKKTCDESTNNIPAL